MSKAHPNLTGARKDKAHLDAAIAAYRQAIALRPDFAEAYGNLGNALRRRGQLDEAIAACRQAVALAPHLVEAHNNLGNVLRDKGQLEEAMAAHRQAIALRPRSPRAHIHLGNVLKEAGRLDEAIAAFGHAISLKPDDPDVHNSLGNALSEKGQLEEAIAAFGQSISLKADQPAVHNELGIVLSWLGRFDEAVDCYRRALELDPKLGAAHKNLADIGHQLARPADIERMVGLAADESLPVDDRVRVGFALGKVLDDADRFEEAFAAYARANSLFRASRAAAGDRFDLQALALRVDQLIQEHTPARFQQIGRIGNRSETPVFIVGMPRSGTTLVEQIIASHAQAFGAGEIYDISRLASTIFSQSHAGGIEHLGAAAVAKLAGDHIERLSALGGGAARVVDKMLDNTFALGLIAALFPSSRVIFCQRDARDTCLSCYFQLFQKNLFARDLTDCARFWRQTERLKQHWRAVLPLRMLDVQYEEVVGDLEGQSRRLIDFLGLAWDPACLEFHRTKRPVRTASNWQVRQPLYRQSVGRWRHYQRHLGPMLEALGQVAS